MNVWKRNAVVVAICLFVGAAVYLNWSYNHQALADNPEQSNAGKMLGESGLVNGVTSSLAPSAVPSAAAKSSAAPSPAPAASKPAAAQEEGETNQTGYFASARLNRQQARDSALDLLRQAAADASAEQSVVDEANASIQAMANYTVAEAQIENLVSAKGYGDCVCFLSANGCSMVVSATENGLNETDVARILEIVKQETGLTAGDITIIETKP